MAAGNTVLVRYQSVGRKVRYHEPLALFRFGSSHFYAVVNGGGAQGAGDLSGNNADVIEIVAPQGVSDRPSGKSAHSDSGLDPMPTQFRPDEGFVGKVFGCKNPMLLHDVSAADPVGKWYKFANVNNPKLNIQEALVKGISMPFYDDILSTSLS